MTVRWTDPQEKEVVARYGQGRLERYRSELGEILVAHVQGTPEEIGMQYGALLAGPIEANVRDVLGLFNPPGMDASFGRGLLAKAWERFEPYVPEPCVVEMDAIRRGAQEVGVDLDPLAMPLLTAATNFDMYKREERLGELLADEPGELLGPAEGPPALSCTMLAVWGSRTVDGKLFSHRNLDWISQTGMHQRRLLTVYRPEGNHAFVTMGYAGVIGALAGMNDAGITLSEVGAFSVREELDGTPWALTARRVLAESDRLEDGVQILRDAHHTLGYNYLVADGDPARFGTSEFNPRAAALETNYECCEVFGENDPQEAAASWSDAGGKATHYGLPLTEAILRADTAFGERSRELQAADNGPGEPGQNGDPTVEGSSYVRCHKPMHDMLLAYERGEAYTFPVRDTQVIEAGKPRKIGPEEMLTIAATVAHNVEKLPENDWNVMSVVYAPTDGEFWVAYEHQDESGEWTNAPDTGYWHFRMGELMASEQ